MEKGRAQSLSKLVRAHLPAALTLAAGIAISLWAWHAQRERSTAKAREEFDREVFEHAQDLEQSIHRKFFVLESIRAFYAASKHVDRNEFFEFTKPLLAHSQGIISLSWLPLVSGVDRGEFEAETRAEGISDFQIFFDDPKRQAPQRESYFPIHFIEPQGFSKPPLGLDLADDPGAHDAISRTRDSGTLSICAPMIHRGSGEPSNECTSFLAVYRNGMPKGTAAERQASLHGVLRLVVDLDKAAASIPVKPDAEMVIEFVKPGQPTEPRVGLADGSMEWVKTVDIHAENHTWQIRARTNATASIDQSSARIVLGLGLLLTGLISVLVHTLIGRGMAVRKLVENQTADLLASEARSKAILDSAQAGILSIDAEGHIDDLNFSVEFIFGYSAEELLGKKVSMLLPTPHAEEYECFLADLRGRKRANAFSQSYELLGLRRDGSTFPMEMSTREVKGLGKKCYSLMCQDISERSSAVAKIRRLFTAIEHVEEAIMITDADGIIEYVNPTFEKITGYAVEEAIGKKPSMLKSGKHDAAFYQELWATLMVGETWSGTITNRRKDGTLYEEMSTISPIRDEQGKIVNFVAVKRDISRRIQMEMQLSQAQKLESVGQLAAGIAHEINTPIQYVGDNTRFLRESFQELIPVLAKLSTAVEAIKGLAASQQDLADLPELIEEADLGYLQEEIPKAIDESLQGIDRVTKIVRAMKEFSHPGSKEMTATDLNQAIQSTITVATNEWKYVAETVTQLDPDLPSVTCLNDEFNQVILNMIINAAHAIASAIGKSPQSKGTITISTSHEDSWAEVRIADTGSGIPEGARAKIFDPFFTTKEVGKGTGQGLAIAHDVIVNKHGGSLVFETEVGVGTTFVLRLPITGIGQEEAVTA